MQGQWGSVTPEQLVYSMLQGGLLSEEAMAAPAGVSKRFTEIQGFLELT